MSKAEKPPKSNYNFWGDVSPLPFVRKVPAVNPHRQGWGRPADGCLWQALTARVLPLGAVCYRRTRGRYGERFIILSPVATSRRWLVPTAGRSTVGTLGRPAICPSVGTSETPNRTTDLRPSLFLRTNKPPTAALLIRIAEYTKRHIDTTALIRDSTTIRQYDSADSRFCIWD